jgi:hypothetical protein
MLFGVACGLTTLAVLANILNASIYDIKCDKVPAMLAASACDLKASSASKKSL